MTSKRKKSLDINYNHLSAEYILASFFWVGRLPFVPGTWGSLAALPFWFFIFSLTGSFGVLVGLVVLTLAGAWAIERIEHRTDRAKTHDASVFVMDEVVGQGLVLLPVLHLGWAYWLGAFVMFRFFDILKPWPISFIDRTMHNGWGVMLDDVLAGVMGAFAMVAFVTFAL